MGEFESRERLVVSKDFSWRYVMPEFRKALLTLAQGLALLTLNSQAGKGTKEWIQQPTP